jgi:hypothetical protein
MEKESSQREEWEKEKRRGATSDDRSGSNDKINVLRGADLEKQGQENIGPQVKMRRKQNAANRS